MSRMIRYRFKTHSVDDPRPLIDLATIKMPWWCTGYAYGDEHDLEAAIIVCYLPEDEDLNKYWDDAFDVGEECTGTIKYTDRFPKPDWCS